MEEAPASFARVHRATLVGPRLFMLSSTSSDALRQTARQASHLGGRTPGLRGGLGLAYTLARGPRAPAGAHRGGAANLPGVEGGLREIDRR